MYDMYEIDVNDIWEELTPEYFEEDDRLEAEAREMEEEFIRQQSDLSSFWFYGNRYDD